jgi:hypothetical protein
MAMNSTPAAPGDGDGLLSGLPQHGLQGGEEDQEREQRQTERDLARQQHVAMRHLVRGHRRRIGSIRSAALQNPVDDMEDGERQAAGGGKLHCARATVRPYACHLISMRHRTRRVARQKSAAAANPTGA